MKKKWKGVLWMLALAIVMIFQNPIEARAGHCGGSVGDCGCDGTCCNSSRYVDY